MKFTENNSLQIKHLGYWEWYPATNNFIISDAYASILAFSHSPNGRTLNSYLECITDKKASAFNTLIEACLKKVESCTHTHYLHTKNGDTLRTQEFLTLIIDNPPCIRSTVIDITACTSTDSCTDQSNNHPTHCDVNEAENKLLKLRENYARETQERIQAEKSLWESQRKFKTLLSNLPGMAYRSQYNIAREMEFLSKGSHALTGFHSWDLVGNPIRTYTHLIHSEDIEKCWLQIQDCCKKNRPYKVTYRIKRSDNEQRWVQDQGQAVYSDDTHDITSLEGFIIDITDAQQAQQNQQRINEELEHRVEERTHALEQAIAQLQTEVDERHRIEEQLRISEASLHNAQRIANLGSWDKNIVTRTHRYSDEIFRMLAIDPRNTMPHEDIWTPHIHFDYLDRVLTARANSLADKAPLSIEYKIILSNGDERFIQERAEITIDDNHEPINIATTVLDITESKQIQDELVRYRTHLQELVDAQTKDIIEARDAALAAERAMSSFIANMSHEIRTPLHGILSFSNFGLKKIESADQNKLKNYFQEIHDSGETLLSLLNELLDLSKLKAGKMMYSYQEADLAQTIQLAAKEFSALRTEKNISLIINASAAYPGKFDKDKIRQVLRNLISNAIKFSPHGSLIEINIIDIGDDYYEISICDQGPGIPNDELLDIFSPFVQSSTTQSKAGGTGLGLAICKEIIESGHGGVISASNNPDSGATFSMRIAKKTE